MEVVNDARLIELVREPARELLPAARRASVVQPLVVLLAFLPGLLGFWNRPLDEATCRQGLLALDVTAGERPLDWFVIASRNTAERSSPAFPLTTLLTAAGLQLDLLSPESRLRLVAYLSSAVLLLCVGSLAKKVGGSRFALLTVCLACGHREFLSLSGSLPPVALPLAFAVLAFRGMWVHYSSGGPLMSWSLVATSLALAACWLAGGELAIATWFVLVVFHVLSVFSRAEPLSRGSWGRVIGQRLSNLMMALVSLLFVTLIAVAIVTSWQSAFSEKISLPNLAAGTFWPRRLWPFGSRFAAASFALMQMMGAWLGFVLLGVVQVFRLGTSPRNRESTHGVCFLVGWSAVAWMSWWMTWTLHRGESANASAWTGFLLLPLLFLAAWGLEAVLQREFGLGSVLTATLVTLGVVFAPQWSARLPSSLAGSWFTASLLAGVILVWGGLYTIRKVAKSESHSRRILSLCVAILVLIDLTNGIFSGSRLADDERELGAFRRQLITESPPDECWLLTEEASPARLRFFLRSLWRGVVLREAKDWETILLESPQTSTAKLVEPGSPSGQGASLSFRKARAVVVTWGSSRLPAEDLKRRGQALTQATAPHYFQGRHLKGYRWIKRHEGPISR